MAGKPNQRMTHSTSPPSKLTQQPHELHKAVGTLLSLTTLSPLPSPQTSQTGLAQQRVGKQQLL